MHASFCRRRPFLWSKSCHIYGFIVEDTKGKIKLSTNGTLQCIIPCDIVVLLWKSTKILKIQKPKCEKAPWNSRSSLLSHGAMSTLEILSIGSRTQTCSWSKAHSIPCSHASRQKNSLNIHGKSHLPDHPENIIHSPHLAAT